MFGHDPYECCCSSCALDILEQEQTPGIIEDTRKALADSGMVGGTDHGYQPQDRLGDSFDQTR